MIPKTPCGLLSYKLRPPLLMYGPLVNQPMLNGALVIEMVNNSFSESKKHFYYLTKRETS